MGALVLLALKLTGSLTSLCWTVKYSLMTYKYDTSQGHMNVTVVYVCSTLCSTIHYGTHRGFGQMDAPSHARRRVTNQHMQLSIWRRRRCTQAGSMNNRNKTIDSVRSSSTCYSVRRCCVRAVCIAGLALAWHAHITHMNMHRIHRIAWGTHGPGMDYAGYLLIIRRYQQLDT